MKKYIWKIVLIICCVICVPSSEVRASTIVDSQVISSDEVWNKEGSPYIITNDHLDIAEGITLIINPGVVVKSEGAYMQVFGTLNAQGTEQEPITITSYSDDSVGGDSDENGVVEHNPEISDGRGIYFYPTSINSSVSFLKIKYSQDGLYFNSTKISLSHIDVQNSQLGITAYKSDLNLNTVHFSQVDNPLVVSERSNVKMQGALIENGRYGDLINVMKSNFTLRDSTLSNAGDYSSITISQSTSTLLNVFIKKGNQNGIVSNNSLLTISSSTIREFLGKGIFVKGGITKIDNSSIQNNYIGIQEDKVGGPVLSLINSLKKVFSSIFFSKALAAENTSLISIEKSIIQKNISYGILNNSTDTIDAKNNYWGDDSGPKNDSTNALGKGNKVSDNVIFSPWTKILEQTSNTSCCSNILFIPGFEATRLNKGTNQLWEPNIFIDVDKLHLNENGLPVDPLVTVGDIIKQSNIGGGVFDKNIYKSFYDEMNQLVSTGTIKTWKDFPYDWRLNLPIDSMISMVTQIASSSKTGKVSIVTHSNGGLMAKKLMLALRNSGKENLIDKIVFVAVPHIGTPSSIGALLNGEEQEIGPLGFNLSKGTAQSFGQNLIGAYNLLPSQAYFNKSIFPVVSSLGKNLNSFSSMKQFITSSSSPSILRNNLLSLAEKNHNDLDLWQPSSSTKIFQVVGNDFPTTRSADYFSSDHQIIKDNEGDGTVSLTSSLFMKAPSYIFDITKYAKEGRGTFSHASILEAKPVIEIVKNLLQNSSIIPSNISTTTPQLSSSFELREFSVHSPVTLDVFDSKGNHTGIVKNANSQSDLGYIENNIPGSVYQSIGEGKYVSISEPISPKILMKGTGIGTFTFKIKDQFASSTVIKAYQDIPVTDLTIATLDTSSSTASTTLVVDSDGDGKTDFLIKPTIELDPISYLQIFKKLILACHLPKIIEELLLAKLDVSIKSINSYTLKNFTDKIKIFSPELNSKKWKANNLSELEKLQVIALVLKFVNNL